MASKTSASAALFFSLNLVFFALVIATHSSPCPPPSSPKSKPHSHPSPPSPKPEPRPNPNPRPTPLTNPATPTTPTMPTTPTTPTNTPFPPPPTTTTSPTNPTTPGTPSGATCPRDALKLGVCADLLGLVNVVVGSPPTLPCCSLIQGLADLEAAVCLCTAIRANVLGINLNIPVSLSLILNNCGRRVPTEFQCA